jgi:hypothetical protein
VKRSERCLGGGLNAVWNRFLRGEIASPQKAESVDQLNLFERRAANEAAVIELRRRQGSQKTRFAARNARNASLHEEAGSDDPKPGSRPVDPGRSLVGRRIEVACTSS